MGEFYHNSLFLKFREPFGAAPCSSVIRLRCECADHLSATVRTWCETAGDVFYPMWKENGMATADITLPDTPGLFWYSFDVKYPDGTVRYYGAGCGEGRFTDQPGDSYGITVYRKDYKTPDWFKGGVIYQIFPDRFCRSSWEDFHNRIDCHVRLGRHPRIHERWSEEPTIEPMPGEEDYEPNDFFGGDINGIIEKLPYLASFGVTCIYLNPVFASPSNHRYNTSDYMHVDPVLGSDDDLRRLACAAKEYGMQLMLDGVFSHTGSDSVYFNREKHYGEGGAYNDPDSPYRSWYTFREDGTYDCWWGFETLPNVWELTSGYVDFIAGANGVLKRWSDMGISNWRLDVADELPDEFIRILRKKVKELNPDAVLLGEVWDEPTRKIGPEGRRGYVNGDELDSVMNYTFTDAVLDYLNKRITAQDFSFRMQNMREMYPEPFYLACMNLMGSHDVPRAITGLSGAPDRHDLTIYEQKRFVPKKEEAEKGLKRILLASVIQVTMPGVPSLYYGDEAGLTGMADPFNRRTYPWGNENQELLQNMRKIFSSRKTCEALRTGKARFGTIDEVFCIIRYTADSMAVAIINGTDMEKDISICPNAFQEGPDGQDILDFSRIFTDLDGTEYSFGPEIKIQLKPLSCFLLKS